MNNSINISENATDAMYDAATAQYAYQTLKLLRREYNLASPHEQEAINSLIKQGAQIVFNSDLPEVYVAIFWQRIDLDKRGLGDWGYATREIFIEDDHVSTRGFAGACHFNGPIAYETFYPLNPTDNQLTEAREKAERYTKKAAALLASGNRSVPTYAETPDMHILFGGVSKSAAANMTRLAAVIEATSRGADIVAVDIEQDLNNLRTTYKSDDTTDEHEVKETRINNANTIIDHEKAANSRAYANTEARTATREALQTAYAALVENGAYEEAMSGDALDWNEVACYETAVAEIASLIKVMPVNDGTASGE